MFLRSFVVLLTVVGVIGLSSCRTAPIRDFTNEPVPPGLTIDQVSKAIHSAGNSLGWAMRQKDEGMIIGTLNIRSHMAQVEIPFSRSSYSIRYKDSSNLKFDEQNRSIHSNYDGWIQNLNNQIRARLASM